MNEKIHVPILRKNPEPIDFKPEVGLTVKIVHHGERFWVIIKQISEDKLIGSVDNNLIENEEYDYGDLVSFKKDDVWDIGGYYKQKLKLVVNNE